MSKPRRKNLKKVLIVLFVILAILLTPKLVIYYLNNGNPYHKYLMNKYVPNHLEEQGYSDNDIIEQKYIDPKHPVNKKIYHGHYLVVFKDEPDLEYFYGVTKLKKRVVQFCEKSKNRSNYITEKTLHSESECITQFNQ